MTYVTWLPILLVLGTPGALLAQERMYEWRWEMHPMWWGAWGTRHDVHDVVVLGPYHCRDRPSDSLAAWAGARKSSGLGA